MPQKHTRRQTKLNARNADKHALYQLSVQSPPDDIPFFERVYVRHYGRKPLSLREDFCGTALMSAYWVRSHKDRTATGLDLDTDVLEWGRRNNLPQLGEAAKRVRLLRRDVRAAVKGPFDLAIGLNFSYFIFKEREQMRRYFESVRRSLGRQGLFILDHYGGPESQEELIEETVYPAFRYEWEQDAYNPIDGTTRNHIHFRFRDGSRLKDAFIYDWRLWNLAELQELLREAGFRHVEVYWEGDDGEGGGNGIFRRRRRVENDPCWNAYLISRP